MIERILFSEAYSSSMQDGPTIWMKMMLKFVIFKDPPFQIQVVYNMQGTTFSYTDV